MTILPLPNEGAPTAYLGLSGVVHPSESSYRFMYGRTPWEDGHTKFEGTTVLERALAPWPDVRIVLTSTLPRIYGLATVLESLGPGLAARVDGFSYDDIPTRIQREVQMRSGGTRTIGYASNDYWRMNKCDIVAIHVAWRRPVAWVAIDDEDMLWPTAVRDERLVLTDPCRGLNTPATLDRLQTVLEMNFGAPSPQRTAS